jgi:DNA-binding response OmpR family regulator
MTARKVLIVEDNAALLRGLKDNFQAQGYQVRTASDGAKGMEDFFRDPPDLVLLDLMLPKVNGYEICRQARSRQLTTPILMLSAKGLEDDVVRGFELGADDYVIKPFGIRELMARAQRLSRRSAAPRTVDGGPRTVDCGPRTVDGGLRTVDGGLRTVDSGLRTVDGGLRTVDGGLRTVDGGCL